MARLPILEYPDPRLRMRAEPVTEVNDAVKQLVADMLETMYAAPGIGLAATQVNVHKRLLVVDISADCNEPCCLINPEIVAEEGRTSAEEGPSMVPATLTTHAPPGDSLALHNWKNSCVHSGAGMSLAPKTSTTMRSNVASVSSKNCRPSPT